ISITLYLVQKQLIIYLWKASITNLCNQQVTGGPEARFLDHENRSLCTGIDDQRPAGPGDAAARAARVLHPPWLGNLRRVRGSHQRRQGQTASTGSPDG